MRPRVLVVDDDPEFRALARRLIISMGMDVAGEADTVAAATGAAADLRPDAALVDVGLPDGDGAELARRLAALPWRPRVVITSSDADVMTPAGALTLGAVGFLPKATLADGMLRDMLAE
jgi:DNA-binding NarL/FixJ family response regulator